MDSALDNSSSHAGIVPTDVSNQIIPPKANWKREWNFTCHVPNVCYKLPENVPHVLAGCGTLPQTKYLARHNAVLKILFFKLLKDLELISEVPPWH